MEISWKCTASAVFLAIHPKLYRNCLFPQHLYTSILYSDKWYCHYVMDYHKTLFEKKGFKKR